MDIVTRPNSARTRQAGSRSLSASVNFDFEDGIDNVDDDGEETEAESLPSDAKQSGTESESESESSDSESNDADDEPVQRKPDPRASRQSSRKSKAVNYSSKYHPQDANIPGFQHKAKQAKRFVKHEITSPAVFRSQKRKSEAVTIDEDVEDDEIEFEDQLLRRPRKQLRTVDHVRISPQKATRPRFTEQRGTPTSSARGRTQMVAKTASSYLTKDNPIETGDPVGDVERSVDVTSSSKSVPVRSSILTQTDPNSTYPRDKALMSTTEHDKAQTNEIPPPTIISMASVLNDVDVNDEYKDPELPSEFEEQLTVTERRNEVTQHGPSLALAKSHGIPPESNYEHSDNIDDLLTQALDGLPGDEDSNDLPATDPPNPQSDTARYVANSEDVGSPEAEVTTEISNTGQNTADAYPSPNPSFASASGKSKAAVPTEYLRGESNEETSPDVAVVQTGGAEEASQVLLEKCA